MFILSSTCIYDRFHCDVDGVPSRNNQRSTPWCQYVHLSITLCIGLLCLSFDGISTRNIHIAVQLVWNIMVGFDLVGTGVCLGN